MGPVRAVVQLVGELVEPFFHDKRAEQRIEIIRIAREERSSFRGGTVCPQKSGHDFALPELGPRRQAIRILGTGARRDVKSRQSRVAERSHHAGYVTQRRTLLASFFQWPRGLSLEVEDDDVGF